MKTKQEGKKIKVAIYIRVSTEEQTPQDQLKDILGLVKNKDYSIVIETQSAFKDDIRARPKFKELINLVKQDKLDRLYCWDLDRLYRNRVSFVSFWKLCKLHNTKIISFRQEWLNKLEMIPEPFNEMIEDWLINFYGWIAEDESKKKSERVRKAFENHKGKKWGRPLLKVNTSEIMRLRNDGLSIRAISDKTGIDRNKVYNVVCKSKGSK